MSTHGELRKVVMRYLHDPQVNSLYQHFSERQAARDRIASVLDGWALWYAIGDELR